MTVRSTELCKDSTNYKPRQLPKFAKTERAIFNYMYFHPGSTLVQAAKDLKLSYFATTRAWERLRASHDLTKLCPICFHETLFNGVCHTCGFEDKDSLEYESSELSSHEPVFMIQSHNGLGTETDYSMLHLKYGAKNIAHLVEHEKDRRFEKIKSMLLEELKRDYPDPEITNLAARILKYEYLKFKVFYPDLLDKTDFGSILIKGVLKELKRWLQ